MNAEPGFAVLMATYAGDDPRKLAGALHSVYANTVQPAQCLLVIDGPVGTQLSTVIDEFCACEASFEILRLPRNRGLACALNHGLKKIRESIVFRADADDINLPHRFATQLSLLAQGYDVVGSAIREVDDQGQVQAVRALPCNHADIVRFMPYRCPFNHMTVAFRTELALRCGGYPEIQRMEDYPFWASLLRAGARTANSPDVLVEASAGSDLYQRRGGIPYVWAEIQVQRHLVRCGIKSVWAASAHGLLRATVFLLPATWRGRLYRRFLRQTDTN